MKNRFLRLTAVPLGAGVTAALLTGCGTQSGQNSGSGDSVVMGMSDAVTSLDPASGYDVGSWLVFNNVFQSLIAFPRGGTVPQPEAAESCGFKDTRSKLYVCTLKEGLKFSNGHELTTADVKYSFERTARINDANGPAFFFDAIDKIETSDDRTITFRLKYSDATFPLKIASGAGSIVDHTEYPADKLREGDSAVGSGPYKLDSYKEGKEAVFTPNPGYRGAAKLKNSGMTLKLYGNDTGKLKKALEAGDIDLAYRGLAVKDIAELEKSYLDSDNPIQVVEGTSAEIQHLVFNLNDPVAGKLAVRRAMAYVIDRSALVRDVYKRTAEPLYSIIPAGIVGHNTAFYDTYGESPDPARAAQELKDGGIATPVPLKLYVTPERYGPGTLPGFRLIADQLNKSGLFDAEVVDVKKADEYQKGMEDGRYGVYVKGWVPDYPDPDNFTLPFFGKGNVLSNNYPAGKITDDLLPRTAAEADRGGTVQEFEEVQDIVAQELPVLPLWQGKQYAVAKENILGLEGVLDASTVFRFWEIEKGAGE
ncbi:putative D,D-dipeptide-binding periplasmic protein DdpA [Streptomyces sp. RB5]|uniref:Putative D,D-dipeptide-binding periplasmic protein DdpA n=1 Tax=Streptomyces smaragdinus TaxID=2585196 RepID=A0A7K0CKF2_9ACTN|nr:ABC transporter substrate-binding protein [Streptomyces smaragdinus]MQY13980.1 putative D,D-dipeptide-binding periplasmic protein DdpA [Streptomyces smaragdinus]